MTPKRKGLIIYFESAWHEQQRGLYQAGALTRPCYTRNRMLLTDFRVYMVLIWSFGTMPRL